MSKFDYDVVIIGGGVIGAAVARELSAYPLKTCLLEKCEDICSGTSKANSAIVHGGYDAPPGSKKAEMNVLGNQMMEQLAEDLDFSFERNGSLVLCFDADQIPLLEELYQRGQQNGVPGMAIISGEKARHLECNLSDKVVAALHVPSGGIVCPFGLTLALAENAAENGVEFQFETEVKDIETLTEGFLLKTNTSTITARYVVNAAGVYADVFHNMVSSEKIQIMPRKGSYLLLDKEAGNHVSHTIFQLPGKHGKGVLVTPTVHGNLLIGPTSYDIEDKEAISTSADELKEVAEKAALSVKGIPYRQVITSFAGLRAHEAQDDFILGEAKDAAGFFDAAGMESPGLSCAPAIGVYLAAAIAEKAAVRKKADYLKTRRGIPQVAAMNRTERARLIKERPDYGIIVCRCENVSEGEIRDAIQRPLGAKSLDGVKRRVRQGMGRCQAGFCTPGTMEILAQELGIPTTEVCKNTVESKMLAGKR